MDHTSEQLQRIDQIANRYREQTLLDELRDDDVTVTVYFDTYHILPLIQGYWELQKNIFNDIDVQTFKDDRFLVKSLAYFGHIKNLRILLPHAVELSNQLDKTYLLPNDYVDQEKIDKFLESVRLDDLKRLKERAKNNRLEDYLTTLEPHAVDLFKANYVLDKLIWTKRYNHLFDVNSFIQYDDWKYDNSDILQSKLFLRLLDALATSAEARKHKTVNNLRDAMALCMFHQKVKQFRKTKKNLPLFYVSGGVLAKLEDSLLKEFEVVYKKNKTINTLKDTEFFIVDSMFPTKSSESEDETFRKMRNVRESVDVYTRIGVIYPGTNIDELIKEWENLRANNFFKKLWPLIKKSLNKNIIGLIDYEYLLKNQELFNRFIKKEKKKIGQSLDARVNDLVFLEDIWKEVETFNQVLKERVNENSILFYERADIYRDEGLTRFSSPTGYIEDEIKQLWSGFLDSYFKQDNSVYQSLKVRLTKHIYEGFLRSDRKNFEKILIGISILYVFHKDALILKLIKRLNGNYGTYYQIVLVYMASMIRSGKKTSTDLYQMKELIVCIESKEWYPQNYKAWLGIAFIKFNIWKMMRSGGERQLVTHYLEESIRLIQKAYRYLYVYKDQSDQKSVMRNVKYYYCLNNYIYYSLHSETKEISDTEFHEYVDELMGIQDENEYSQCRFSDTIAFYYYRRAKGGAILKDRLADLQIAESYSNRAIDTAVFKDGKFSQMLERVKVLKNQLILPEKY